MSLLPGMAPIMLVGGLMVGVPTLAAAGSLSDDTQYNSATSLAQITISAAGDIVNETTALGSYDNGDWLAPQSGMEEFSVRWTNTSGTINVGTAASWQALTASRTFGCTIGSGSGTKTATGTLEIARTDATGTVLATKTGIVLTARSSPLSPP